jgi:tetratricopeptide (TPR) repeat protein
MHLPGPTLAGSILAGLLLLAPATQVWAKSKAENPEKAAKKACAAGDYAKGVEILADLYVQTNDATYIFNQARCYEQAHQWTRAIDRFREFLLKAPDSSSDASADAEKHIAKCKSYLADDEGKAAVSLPPATVPVVVFPPPVSPPVQEVSSNPRVATTTTTSSALPTAGIVVGGVGLASLVTAVVLNVKANQFANAGDGSSQKSYRNGALICYGVGGAAVATGIVLYLVGHKRSSESSSVGVALLPTWTPDGAALVLGGEF